MALQSLDVQTIPTMLGSLLEPELLADVLAALLQGSQGSTSLIVDVMSVLPRCQRFETSWMCLEEAERKRECAVVPLVYP